MIWSRNPLGLSADHQGGVVPLCRGHDHQRADRHSAISLAMMAGLAARISNALGTAMRRPRTTRRWQGSWASTQPHHRPDFVIGRPSRGGGVMVASYYGIAHYAMGSQLA